MYKDRKLDHKNYYASVTSLDHNVGRLIRTLEEQGILDNTLIIISTDHGGSFQDRPGSYRGMGIAFDEAAKIPMIMHWPGGLPKAVTWQSGVNLVDDPEETANLYYQAEYREQLRQQLSLMLERATDLRDELAIRLAGRELAIIDEPDYKYKLY